MTPPKPASDAARVKPSASTPSTLFLVVLNGLLFFVLLAWDANIFGLILGVFATGVFVVVSGIWHGVILLIERRWRFHPVLRTVGFLLPLIAVVVLPGPQRVNQQRPAVSPSGSYTSHVGTEDGYWNFSIDNAQGEEIHLQHTDFVAILSIYWAWDSKDRFWIYNSDDGSIHYWQQLEDDSWEWVRWSEGGKEAEPGLSPPPDLFPEHAKDD